MRVRICVFFLKKIFIGYDQSSETIIQELEKSLIIRRNIDIDEAS
jgi:hypothetical protein